MSVSVKIKLHWQPKRLSQYQYYRNEESKNRCSFDVFYKLPIKSRDDLQNFESGYMGIKRSKELPIRKQNVPVYYFSCNMNGVGYANDKQIIFVCHLKQKDRKDAINIKEYCYLVYTHKRNKINWSAPKKFLYLNKAVKYAMNVYDRPYKYLGFHPENEIKNIFIRRVMKNRTDEHRLNWEFNEYIKV